MELAKIIKKPIITEKSTGSNSLGRYGFWVDQKADKKQIKKAIEFFFKVHIKRVWTLAPVAGPNKKAVVQLTEGEKIEIFESGE